MFRRLLLSTVIGLSCLLQAANPQLVQPKQPISGQVTLSQADFEKFAAEYKITDPRLLAQFKNLIDQLHNQNISPEAKKQHIRLLAKQLIQEARSKRIWAMVAVASIIFVIIVVVFIAALTLEIAPHGKYSYIQQRLDMQKKELVKLVKKNEEIECKTKEKELEQQENIRKHKIWATFANERKNQDKNFNLEKISLSKLPKKTHQSTVTFEEIGDPNAFNDNNI